VAARVILVMYLSVVGRRSGPQTGRFLDVRRDARQLVWHEIDRAESAAGRKESMNILLIILGVIAVILLLTGGFVPTLNFLLWVGIVIAVIALIVWLVRMISGRRVV